jgi:DNA-binding transcriptional MocR family regulator
MLHLLDPVSGPRETRQAKEHLRRAGHGIPLRTSADPVAAVGTVTKSLSPALRLGWLVCPPGLADTIADEMERDDRDSPVLNCSP